MKMKRFRTALISLVIIAFCVSGAVAAEVIVIPLSPNITQVFPARGPSEGGIWTLIIGSNFISGANVRFGMNYSENVIVINSTRIIALLPPGISSTIVDVLVVNPNEQWDILSDAFTYVPPISAPPNVTYIDVIEASPEEGETVTVNATFIDAMADTHIAIINWGDNTVSLGGIVYSPPLVFGLVPTWKIGNVTGNHVYGDNGKYEITVIVIDQDGARGFDSLVLDVDNSPPGLAKLGNQNIKEGDPTVFVTIPFSDPGSLDTHKILIEWGDGNSSTIDPAVSPVTASYTYPADDGSYTARVTVIDDDGDDDVEFIKVDVANENPVIANIDDQIVEEGDPTVNVSFSFTDPGALDTHRATIWWGDNKTNVLTNVVSPVDITHTYDAMDDNQYTVAVVVEDDDGGSGEESFTVTVTNGPPIIDPIDPQNIAEGNPTVEVNITFTDLGIQDTHTATIQWGDGGTDNIIPATSPINAVHTYAIKDDAQYEVNVIVTDDDKESDTESFTVTVFNEPPDVQPINTQEVPENDPTVAVRIMFTDPGTRDTHRAMINWGDATNDFIINRAVSPMTADHTYSLKDDAEYIVTITVEDDDGGGDKEEFLVIVTNRNPSIFPIGDQNAPESDPTIAFSASFTDPGIEDTHVATIDWGDGEINDIGPATSPFPASHTYAGDSGVYTVNLTVIDGDGGSDVETFTATIFNEAPVIEPIGDQSVPEGDPTFTVVASFADPGVMDEHTAIIHWGDDQTDDIVPAVSPISVTHTYELRDNTQYTVSVTVMDDDGGSDTETSVVTVTNEAPFVEPIEDQTVPEGDPTVNLDAIFIDPGTADTHTADINWGDGHIDTISPAVNPISISHTYNTRDDAQYAVSVVVYDDDGGVGTEEFAVTVINENPVVEPMDGQSVPEGDPAVSLTASFTDPGTDTHTLVVDWGDGTGDNIDSANNPVPIAHTYSKRDNAQYEVRVTVEDDDGGIGSETFPVIVTNEDPVVDSISDQNAPEGDPTVNLDASFTDPGLLDTHRFVVDWGDGVEDNIDPAASPVPIAHTYSNRDDARYEARVTVEDDDGGIVSEAFAVTVTNERPVIAPMSDQSLLEGDPTLSFSVDFMDPGTADIHNAMVNWGDGKVDNIESAVSPISVSHEYVRNDGSYNVVVTVRDDDRGSAVQSFGVTVGNEPPVIDPIGPQSFLESNPVLELGVGFIDPGTLDTHRLVVEWGDGIEDAFNRATSPVTIRHTYTDDLKQYDARVTVTDNDGGVDTVAFTVILANEKPVIDPISDQTVSEGDPSVSLSVAYMDAGGSDQHSAVIDWGDGTSDIVEVAISPIESSHTYPGDDERYAASVTVSDDSGGSDTRTFTVTVINEYPVVDPIADQSIPEGDPTISFNASFTDPGLLDTHRLVVDWGDDSGDNIDPATSPVNATHTYSNHDDSQYTVSVTVADDEGATGTETFIVTVVNEEPIVDPIGDQSVPESDPTINLSASFADPGIMDTHRLVVDWGDGSEDNIDPAASPVAAVHTYDNGDDAQYAARVTVTDDEAGVDTETFTVFIVNEDPVIAPIADQTIPTDDPTVSVNVSFVDPGALDTHTAVIDWGDSSIDTVDPAISPILAEHTYFAGAGQYAASVTVTDDDGGAGVESFAVNVFSKIAVEPIAPQSVDEGSPAVNLTISLTGAQDLNALVATIDWGDDTTEIIEPITNPITAQHTYLQDDGTYAGIITVTDNNEAVATGLFTVNVRNVSPVVDAGGNQTTDVGKTFALNAAFTDVSPLDTHTAQINWGDDTVEAAAVVESGGAGTVTGSHIYAGSGAYTVTVTVIDDDGGEGTDNLTVTAAALTPVVTAISPDDGPVGGGTRITIAGRNFVPGAEVSIGNSAANNVLVASAREITAIAPSGTSGTVDVVVVNPGGRRGVLADGFIYTAGVAEIFISPQEATVEIKQTQQFSASGRDAAENPYPVNNTDVTWSVANADVGEINSGGLFTAKGAGKSDVVAIFKKDSSIRATAQVEVEDTEPPSVVSEELFPESQDKNVPINSSIPISFSEPVDMESVEDGGVSVKGAGDRDVEGEFSYDSGTDTLFFTPDEPLQDEETITVIITTAVMDLAGNRLLSTLRTSFTTGISIWPGDANNDGEVNSQDIIPVGQYWEETGQQRDAANSEWALQPAVTWDSGSAAAHADTNGDGVVNEQDIMPIAINWHLSHTTNQLAPALTTDRGSIAKESRMLGVYESMHNVLMSASDEIDGVRALRDVLWKLIVNTKRNALPYETRLLQNFPNPFNPETWIPYQLAEDASVRVSIYDVNGVLIRTFHIGEKPAGYYNSRGNAIYWDGKNRVGEQISSGIYFCRLQAGQYNDVRKLIVAR